MEARSPTFLGKDNIPYTSTAGARIFIYVRSRTVGEAAAKPAVKYELINGRMCQPGTQKRIFIIPTENPQTKKLQVEHSFFITTADVAKPDDVDQRYFTVVRIQNSSERPFKTPQEIKLESIGEVILIVGAEQHAKTKGMKLVFPAQAVREIRENRAAWDKKIVTVLIFTQGYTREELRVVATSVEAFHVGTNLIGVDSTEKVLNYINSSDCNNQLNRLIAIESIIIFTHGLPSKLTFNMDGKGERNSELDETHVSRLLKTSFSDTATIYSYACRTGSSTTAEKIDASKWRDVVKPEDSLAQKLANHLGLRVFAFVVRTRYTPTWNDQGDNAYRSKFVDLQDKSVDATLWRPQTWDDYDEALWNPDGGKNRPIGDDSPTGPPMNMLKFERGKVPL